MSQGEPSTQGVGSFFDIAKKMIINHQGKATPEDKAKISNFSKKMHFESGLFKGEQPYTPSEFANFAIILHFYNRGVPNKIIVQVVAKIYNMYVRAWSNSNPQLHSCTIPGVTDSAYYYKIYTAKSSWLEYWDASICPDCNQIHGKVVYPRGEPCKTCARHNYHTFIPSREFGNDFAAPSEAYCSHFDINPEYLEMTKCTD